MLSVREYLVATFKFMPEMMLRAPVAGKGASGLLSHILPPCLHPLILTIAFQKACKMQFKFPVPLNQLDLCVSSKWTLLSWASFCLWMGIYF